MLLSANRGALFVSGLIVALTSIAAAQPATAPSDRPNVIVIVDDDMGYADLSIQGDKQISTPNIDSIAKNGVRFTQGYTTGPYCSPSRAGLMSGRYQERFGYDFNPDGCYSEGPDIGLPRSEATMGEVFHAAGYRTEAIGKWHMGVKPELQPTGRGFDHFFGFLPAKHPYAETPEIPESQGTNAGFPGQAPGHLVRDGKDVVEKEYTTNAFGREAVTFLKKTKGSPFFLYFAPNAVHIPMQAPKKYVDQFPSVDGVRKYYLAQLACLDENVGRVLSTLRDIGEEDNTIIFFMSDNGGPTEVNGSDNGPFRGGKLTVWEGGVRVPMFLQWKAHLPRGIVLNTPVIQLDLFPTLLDAAGIEKPKEKIFDGHSILGLVEQKLPDSGAHDTYFWRFGQEWAVREQNWKLTNIESGGNPSLFDMTTDPGESIDLATQHPEIVKQMTEEWKDWNRQNIDPRWIPKIEKWRKLNVPKLPADSPE